MATTRNLDIILNEMKSKKTLHEISKYKDEILTLNLKNQEEFTKTYEAINSLVLQFLNIGRFANKDNAIKVFFEPLVKSARENSATHIHAVANVVNENATVFPPTFSDEDRFCLGILAIFYAHLELQQKALKNQVSAVVDPAQAPPPPWTPPLNHRKNHEIFKTVELKDDKANSNNVESKPDKIKDFISAILADECLNFVKKETHPLHYRNNCLVPKCRFFPAKNFDTANQMYTTLDTIMKDSNSYADKLTATIDAIVEYREELKGSKRTLLELDTFLIGKLHGDLKLNVESLTLDARDVHLAGLEGKLRDHINNRPITENTPSLSSAT